MLGFFLPEESLMMMVNEETGEFFIPVSSGSGDPLTIKIALASFSMTLLYTTISLFFRRSSQSVYWVYNINSAFYLFYMLLVSIDSSIFIANDYGNWIPLGQFLFWVLSFILITSAKFKNVSKTTNDTIN